MTLITYNIDLYINVHNHSCEGICEKHVQGMNNVPEKGAYNDILLNCKLRVKKD